MQPQFPFKVKYVITQGYDNVATRYNGQHHGALDIVPLDATGHGFPADEYPILAGKVIDVQDFPAARGKAMYINSEIDQPFIDYLKGLGYVPKDYTGRVFIKHNYFHMLQELVSLNQDVTQDTVIAKCGNTGMVFTGNPPVPVPDDQKGVPPYPGLHLHLETVIHPNDTSHPFNLDKDSVGRIDPTFILNYKATMPKFYRINDHGKLGVLVVDGFSIGGIFESEFTDYQELLKITGDAATAPEIILP